ncbi:MAG: hypothetical protein LBO77_00365 [Desulfovibrio sp.]|jgi:hypothetical protein|nr:hypothetical protein [Desulfovibrio sp.]
MTNASYSLPRDEPPIRISVTPYSAEEILRLFLALYESLDFSPHLAELGITALHIRRRHKALREFRALSIALWRLALRKSFPQDADAFFAALVETAPFLAGSGKDRARLRERVNVYVDIMEGKKDSDFLPVATALVETLAPRAGDGARLRLKLSLLIRGLYTLIFEKLV